MKFNFISLLLLILFSKQVKADGARCFCFEATITTASDENIRGYFNFITEQLYFEWGSNALVHQDTSYEVVISENKTSFVFINPKTDLSRQIINEFYEDTIVVFQDMILVPIEYYDTILYQDPALLGRKTKIPLNKIQQVKIHSFNICETGGGVFTNLEKKDAEWITKTSYKSHQRIGYSEICDYITARFADETAESTLAIAELRDLIDKINNCTTETGHTDYDAVEKLWLLFDQKAQELKKHKIIIARFCSC